MQRVTKDDAERVFGAYLEALVEWARAPQDEDGALRAQTQAARARYHAALDALAPDEAPSAARSGISMLRELLGRRVQQA